MNVTDFPYSCIENITHAVAEKQFWGIPSFPILGYY